MFVPTSFVKRGLLNVVCWRLEGIYYPLANYIIDIIKMRRGVKP